MSVSLEIETAIREYLSANGLRRAGADESGWYAKVDVGTAAVGCTSTILRVWVTDEPAPDSAPNGGEA